MKTQIVSQSAPDCTTVPALSVVASVVEPTVAQLIALHKLAAFGLACFEASRESFSDLDGAWVQDEAVRCGVLIEVEVTEQCGENCTCVEYDAFPQTCYRLADDCHEVRGRVEAFATVSATKG